MDMRTIQKNRGAVSIFLILVLVPCIAISCIFVDLARVQLARSMAESAADLALNTLLTNYDADLSEYYGLIGSEQKISDHFNAAKEYFLRNTQSQGLSEDEVTLLYDSIKNLYDDSVVVDLLRTSNQAASIQPVENANLGNAALLKDSIVEFMKYRGPIEIASGIIERLKTSGFAELQDAEKNKPLKEAKEDFYKADGELKKAAVYTYLAIQEYMKKVQSSEPGKTRYNNAQLKADEQKIAGYRDVYKQIHEIAVNYLLNTGDLKQYYRVTYNIGDYNKPNIQWLSGSYSSKEEGKDGTIIYYLNGNDFDDLIADATKALNEFGTAMDNYASATSSLMKNNPQTVGGINAVQWWADMDTAVYNGSKGNVHNAIKTKGKKVMQAYSALLAAYENCEKQPVPEKPPKNYKELPNNWKTTAENKLTELTNCYYAYLSGSASGSNGYIKAAKALATVSKNNLWAKTVDNHTVTVNGTDMKISEALSRTASDLSSLHTFYGEVIKLLDNIINGIKPPLFQKQKTFPLDKLTSLAKTYESTFKDYDKEADKSADRESPMGKAEVGVIAGLEIQQYITEASVKALKTRLQNIRGQFVTLQKEIEEMTYGDKSLKDIKNFSTFKSCALKVVKTGEIPYKQSEINSKSSTWLKSLLKPADGQGRKLTNTDNSNYDPNLNENPPDLYKYMKDHFKDLDVDKMNSTDEDEAAADEKKKNFEEGEKGKATAYRGNAGVKIPGYTDASFSVTDILGSTVKLIEKLLKDNGLASIRDDMYVTCYAMEMFSYATYDREAMYRQMTDEHRKNMIPSDVINSEDNKYFKDNGYYGDPAGNLMEQPDTWVSADMEDDYNKSLTNKLINNANNEVYLGEIEYLLYGNAKPEENLKSAYASIYGLRFTLNSISAFHHFWSPRNTTGQVIDGIAYTISSFFGGIVPAAAFKVIMLPMLAAVETCNDNSRLFAGMPVELYKAEPEDWWYSLSGGSDKDSLSDFFDLLLSGDPEEIFRGKNQDVGIYYSDYMTIFVYCALTKNESATYTRLGNLIAANMKRLTGYDEYSLKNTHMYFKLTADFRVDPLMVTVPYYLDEYDHNMDTATDWCSYHIDVVRGYS